VYSTLLFPPCYSNLLLRRRRWTRILWWGVIGCALPRLPFLWSYGVICCSVSLRVNVVFRDNSHVIIILYSWHLVIYEPFWSICMEQLILGHIYDEYSVLVLKPGTTHFSFSREMILGWITITLWNHLAHLLKHFRFSRNEKEVNQNHLKHLFYHFMVAVQKLEMFQTNTSEMFQFFLVGTAPSDSSLNQNRFSLQNRA
jgi:hypothetical protein